MSNLTGLFDNVNRQVTGIADNVGATPQAWNGGVFGMIRNLSDNVILPIAGVILALVATLELILTAITCTTWTRLCWQNGCSRRRARWSS
mgnify:CR=1 FL=1